MRSIVCTAPLGLALTIGCANASLPDPCPPGASPPIGDHTLESPEDFDAAHDDVQGSADWLLCIVPSQAPDPDGWVERRNLVMDWVEGHPELDYTFTAKVMAPVHKDHRFFDSMYMNMAYAIGKARYLLEHDPVDPVEAEVAGLNGVAQLYATLKANDPKLRAPKLERLLRKQKEGKLRPWILAQLAES